ncbi:histidine phosphatase family protein [Terriglobus albidus]|uniref:Histidine phosphatase family protein n=1 Tax=Terriglobus albidus TaxID=1592106 RepID=A0A5B9E6L0_9BACT|nr:histidine phosphatase family protein [Terriglobus albidus]QEE27234.1 histidine phosphatase family protein [Terriglobus albidus]
MSSKPRLFLVRHGETEWSLSGQHTGVTDIPLTENGREKARTVGVLLNQRSFALVQTSPMQRARETCTLLGYGPHAVVNPDLCEWNYGIFEGLTTPQIREQRNDPHWNIFDSEIPNGESIEEVAVRAQRVIDTALAAAPEGDTLLVAHGHILRILAATWLGLEPRGARLLSLVPASLSILGYEHDQQVLQTWNRTPGDKI